ncbi:MAG: Ser-Thr-rich GPI-anchored membrane family protein [Acidobacteriota bacterium]
MKRLSLLIFVLLLIGSFAFSQSITVTSPNGGEDWTQGSSKNITWTATGLTNDVKITLWKNGVLLGLIAKDIDPSSGSYPWTVGTYIGGTAPADVDYKIKIREQGGESFTTEDMSDEDFSIGETGPQPVCSISITSPCAPGNNATLWGNSSKNIVWDPSFSPGGNVKITMTYANCPGESGPVFLILFIISPSTPNDGNFTWTTPDVKGAKCYKITISKIGKTCFGSSGVFKVRPKPILIDKTLLFKADKLKAIKPIFTKVDLAISGEAKTGSTGSRYITYTVNNLNYNIAKLTSSVWFKAWDKANSSKKKQFGLFQWPSVLNDFNSTGEYTANFPVPVGWSNNIIIKIDPFGHIDESNENNNEAEINF